MSDSDESGYLSLPDDEDRDLLQRWTAGDSASGDKLIMKYFLSIKTYFIRRVPEHQEELVQEAFLGLASGKANYRGDAPVRVFIYKIARNILRKHLRNQRPKFAQLTSSLADAYGRRPSSILAEAEGHNLLLDALREISLDDQDLLELRYWQGLSGRELGALLGVSEGTVRTRLQTALRKLGEKYTELNEEQQTTMPEDEMEKWLLELRSMKFG